MIQTKIEIKFDNNPTAGMGLSYGIFILGLNNLVYNNGLNYLNCQFVNTPDVFPDKIQLGATKSDTIDNVLAFLDANWAHPSIVYSRGTDSVFLTLTIEETVSVNYSPIPSFISFFINVTTVGNSFTPTYLKYFFGYKNIVNDTYKCEIYTKINTPKATEIVGKAVLEKGSVKDHLDVVRGTGLSINLEATTELTLEDLYTQDEQNFTVKFYKNNKIIFQGFLKPDGVFQSFVRDRWVITLGCVDGLGALENLSFVKDTGFRFTGKMKAIDIIYNCLKRTGISLSINTSINILYKGLTPTDSLDILNKIYLNSDRYFKVDGQNTGEGTIMSCDEVLRSVLDLFCANITQENGEWYIYKSNELYSNAYVLFRRYGVDGVYINNVVKNLNKSLGSQIDNFYPHHCNGDQRIEIKGGISAFRTNYKYGFVGGFLLNSELVHDGNLNYAGWTIDPVNKIYLINDPLDNTGFKMKDNPSAGFKSVAISNGILVQEGNTFDFKTTKKYNGQITFYFRIKVGSYYLKSSGEWTLVDTKLVHPQLPSNNNVATITYSLKSFPIPISGLLTVEVFAPEFPVTTTIGEVSKIDFINTSTGENVVGEFHTVSRKIRPSSIVKENKTIANGDNEGIIYIGSIYKEDQITRTNLWSRNNFIESKPVLQIAAEETLKIAQKPTKIFSGSSFGYIPYLSVIEINNIDGKFMPIEWNYDTYTNIGSQKLLQLYSAELPDIDYKMTFDYGEVVKPTITS